MSANNAEEAINLILEDMHKYEGLTDKIISILNRNPKLKKIVHSYKYRFKDLRHLKEKIERKNISDLALPPECQKGPITKENIKSRITDISGVRILHLYVAQLKEIHETILSYVNSDELALAEPPKAYTWDPEYAEFFRSLGLISEVKESFYTSVHYVLKPRVDSDITCELQVRTLFEEVWGEIDHTFNYPKQSESRVVAEQLKVLARVVGAGTRLADSIFKLSDTKHDE